ncbi:MAG: hypothetical protein K1X57_20280 [Gemmataceae bacterium]|nr:hypothetical protein [Gemmataceae bacterium]
MFQFDVSGPGPVAHPAVPQSVPADHLELLRQILEIQKEQLNLARAVAMANDGGQRWRNFLAKYESDYPGMGAACKYVLPQIERAYLDTLRDLTERLTQDDEAIDNEFALGEFLDRFGMKLGQLGQLINQIMPLAEAAPPPPAPAEEAEESGKE